MIKTFITNPIQVQAVQWTGYIFDETGEAREITKEEYQEREKRFVNKGHEKFTIT